MICQEAGLPTGTSKTRDRGRPTADGKSRVLPPRSAVVAQRSFVGQLSFVSLSIFSPGATVIVLKLDMRTSPGAAPFGFEMNLRRV